MSAVPISKLNYGDDFFFQEDNSLVHMAKVVQDFMTNTKIKILQWPAKSLYLNIVEDIWNDIYDGPQFQNTKDLK